jgi:methylmalonyl-CoA/ethylmalonyl-CoA epimerase
VITFKHYTVAVHDLDEAIAHYESRFGMTKIGEKAHNPIGNFTYQPVGFNGQVMCHLICPVSDESPIAKLMKERVNPFNPHGEGIYLLAYESDDTDGFVQQVIDNGGKVNRAPNGGNAWVHPTASNFVLMEIYPKKS